MSFIDEINNLENSILENDFNIFKGDIPILFTAVHTMNQKREDGTIKLSEPYTKAIAMYLNKYDNTFTIIKNKDTGVDSNRDNHDKLNIELRRLIKKYNIAIVIDLHGASKDREFDVEFGTLNNLTADYSIIKELEKSFKNNGVTNIEYNNPFKGGAITQGIYNLEDVDVIQIEINGKYRDYNDIEKTKKIIDSLEVFITKYKRYINK